MPPQRPRLSRLKSSTSSVYRRSSRALRRPLQALTLIIICGLILVVGRRNYGKPKGIGPRIRSLHEQARSNHQTLLARQSKTLDAAQREYKRRYGTDPPPGFEAWFNYATKMSSPIIDDFDDMILNQLKPYRGFHSAKCDLTANKLASDDIVRVCASHGNVEVEGIHKDVAEPLVTLMKQVVEALPDLCIVVNTLDQPRTVINHAMLSSLYGPSPPQTCEVQHFQDKKMMNIWNDVTLSCAHDSPARTGRKGSSRPSSQLISDWRSATDLCSMTTAPPFGPILAPPHMRLSNVVRPVLSSAALSTFNDIIYPSSRHFTASIPSTDDSIPWHDKRATLSWGGNSDGGYASGSNWRGFQRQRILSYAKDHAPEAPPLRKQAEFHQHHPSRNDLHKRPKSVSAYLDMGFTNLTSCTTEACDEQRKEFGVKPEMTPQQLTASKLVLSMDGNGADAGLYTLLRSTSAVVKQGLMREWHDSRLIPWLHYIPLTLGMEEMPAMLDYFLDRDEDGIAAGDDVAEAIGRSGAEWAEKALRREDMNVYIFRLLIEMGRRSY